MTRTLLSMGQPTNRINKENLRERERERQRHAERGGSRVSETGLHKDNLSGMMSATFITLALTFSGLIGLSHGNAFLARNTTHSQQLLNQSVVEMRFLEEVVLAVFGNLLSPSN